MYLLWHVGESFISMVVCDGDLICRLFVGFIEARERLAGIRRLVIGRCNLSNTQNKKEKSLTGKAIK